MHGSIKRGTFVHAADVPELAALRGVTGMVLYRRESAINLTVWFDHTFARSVMRGDGNCNKLLLYDEHLMPFSPRATNGKIHITEAAQLLSVNTRTISKWHHAGKFPHHDGGYVLLSDLRRFVIEASIPK